MIEKASTVATYGGSGAALASGAAKFLGLSPDEWSIVGVVGGLVIGAIGLGIKTYFEWVRLKRGQR